MSPTEFLQAVATFASWSATAGFVLFSIGGWWITDFERSLVRDSDDWKIYGAIIALQGLTGGWLGFVFGLVSSTVYHIIFSL